MVRYFRYPKIEFNGKLFLVLKRIRESNNPILDVWKEHLKADIILRKDGFYFFCEEVMDIGYDEI